MGSGPSKDELLYQEVQNGNHDAVKSLRRNGASLEVIKISSPFGRDVKIFTHTAYMYVCIYTGVFSVY